MLVTIQNLQVQYGKQTALQIQKPIAIDSGERIGIIGSNGAGKTTLVRTILGLTHYRGTIRTSLRPEQMAAHLQQNHYASTMPVKVIMETVLNTDIKKDGKLKELIDYFEFGPCLRKRYSALSGGQKQRLTIILVMMQDAPLTFYDEVTSGLEFETRQRLMGKLSAWYKDKKNHTLCIVSHYYEELEMLVDKLLILDKGQVVDFGRTDELFRRYCGKSIFIVDRTQENERLLESFPKLASPAHLIALSCAKEETEHRLAELLINANVNFKRSCSDIEIMSANAKLAYEGKKEACVS